MNSFGDIFRITTWGESHGKAVGVVIDGCPAGLTVSEKEISSYLKENDRPLIELATKRNEPNDVEILSGLFNGKTLGTPISIIIKNCDINKNDYEKIRDIFRPGHGDYTYHIKYNIPVLSGGGRASGRECITRMAAGYIAEKIIRQYLKDFSIITDIESLAGITIKDEKTKVEAIKKCLEISKKGDSTGGIISISIKGIPPGIGEPIFHGINAELASSLMSIKAVKSVEIGSGKDCAMMSGSEFNDDFGIIDDKIIFKSNNNGGILSGISNGSDITVKLAVKPTPSVNIKKNCATIDKKIKNVALNGRHDRNITPRICPIAKAMISIVLINHLMQAGIILKDKINEKE